MLALALDCARYTALPRGGGIEGQEAGLMEKLRILESVYKSFHSMRYTSQKMDEWANSNEAMFAQTVHVEKMRRDKRNGEGAWQKVT